MADRMDDFINRTTARIFQNMVAIACGKRVRGNNNRGLERGQNPTTPTVTSNGINDTDEPTSPLSDMSTGPAHTNTGITMTQPSLSEEMYFPNSNNQYSTSIEDENTYLSEPGEEIEDSEPLEVMDQEIRPMNQDNELQLLDSIEQGTTHSHPELGDENDANMLSQPQSPPLTADLLEIFTYGGENGEEGSALALTMGIVMSWNGIMKYDSKIDRYSDTIKDLLRERDEINHKIRDAENDSSSIAEHIVDRRDEIQVQLKRLRRKLEDTEEKIANSQRRVTRDLRRVLDRYNLLEVMSDSDGGSVVSVHYIHQPLQDNSKSPTPSDIQRHEAEEDIRNKRGEFKEARRKIDLWENYYDNQYEKYRNWVDSGNESTRTFFDNSMMEDYALAMEELRAAERELEEARKCCRDLGDIRPEVDQESEFADYPDDGYRESMEAAMVVYIDRGRIERWIEQEDSNDDEVPECDDWIFRPVDITDSASVFADGKARKKIDHWVAICEEIEVEVPEVERSEEVEGPLDFGTLVDVDVPEEVQIPANADPLINMESPDEVQGPVEVDALVNVRCQR